MKHLQLLATMMAVSSGPFGKLASNQLDSIVSIPKRQKQRQLIRIIHDSRYGTARTAEGEAKMRARRNAYITDFDLLSNTQKKELKLVPCKGNRMHGLTTGNTKYHVQYNKFAAVRANFAAKDL